MFENQFSKFNSTPVSYWRMDSPPPLISRLFFIQHDLHENKNIILSNLERLVEVEHPNQGNEQGDWICWANKIIFILKKYHFRLCHQADTRDILRSLEKQVGVLHQSLQRVSSSSEQFGAVQQEGKVATAVEIVLLHVENLKRSYEKEHNELEDARRILIEHKLLGIKS